MDGIRFEESDGGMASDRWPCFQDEYFPSVRVAMLLGNEEIGHAKVIPFRKSLAFIRVEPGRRGAGHGTALLDECVSRYGIDRLVAFQAEEGGKDTDALVRWYESRGFRVTGINMSRI